MEVTFTKVVLDWRKAEHTDFPPISGVYQVYGTSPLYGMETLLYIGQAENLNARMQYHFDPSKGILGRQPNKSCRYATIGKDLLDVVEKTLIIMHKPSFNSSSQNNDRAVRGKAYYIQNHGDRGLLNLETTNYYFAKDISGQQPDVIAGMNLEDKVSG